MKEQISFSHYSVLLNECIEGLAIRPNGIYIDGTAGGAGHSSVIASHLGEGGKLLALYSAMGPSLHSADTAGGLWYNKLDDEQYTATIIGTWQKKSTGGISVSYTADTYSANTLLSGISLPEEFADLSDFYLESLVTYALLEDSTSTVYSKGYNAFQIDIYGASWFASVLAIGVATIVADTENISEVMPNLFFLYI